MASTSALLNRPLREFVSPVLRGAGFEAVDARNAWAWRGDCTWVFNVRAVGSYFSEVTGWPPGSVAVWLGVFFTFAPLRESVKTDSQGRLRPPEHLCHMRSHLTCQVDQAPYASSLPSQERDRTDLWWVEPDGSNAEQVARDMAASLREQGLPWYLESSHLQTALARTESERDCFIKFTKAALIAKHLGDTSTWRRYDALAEAEAKLIDYSLDRKTWMGR